MTGSAWVTRSPRPITTVPSHAEPDISFVFVTYGTGVVVIAAIASLVGSLADEPVAYEVLVVDNEHPERRSFVENHLLLDTSGVRVIRPGRNLGFGGGCNFGVEQARGATIGLVNPDVEFAAGWLAPLITQLADGPAVIVAPVLLNPDDSVQSAGHRLWSDGSTSPITEPPPPGDVMRPDYASAACWLMRTSDFANLGGFDDAFFPAYYEDVDLALRARTRGGTAVVGDSTVIHHHGASTATGDIPDTTPQRDLLLTKWPTVATDQPAPAPSSTG